LEDKEIISLSQVRDLQKIMAGSATNGDGIITPDATEEKEVSEFIKDVMDSVGTVMDASEKLGIGEEQLNLFLQEAKDYLNWISEKKIPEGKTKTEIMIFGNETPHLYEIFKDVENKIDEYFLQCAMVKFDERTAIRMRLKEKV